ncbi:hypothetical protein F4811DRAFT_555645 [Daldinia bambusicola]|nr:hypothetical protein F4811DRAFT_555645 [Daldinia bambusicola]
MPRQLLHALSTLFATALFHDDVIDHQLNAVRLAVGSRAYGIQSRVLGLPDRYGVFSPGPPRLQVYEARRFLATAFALGYLNAAVWLPALLLLKFAGGGEVGGAVLMIAAMESVVVGVFWAAAVKDPRRRPGYVWRDWGGKGE